ncbi:cell wall anchor protein [Cystobacter fuscus]
MGTAIKDVRDALRSGSAEQRDKAIGSVATAGKTAINTVKGGLELTRDVQKFGGAYRAASQAFRTAAPNATGKAVRAAATTAAGHAFQGATEGVARRGVQEAVKKAAQGSSIANTMGAATRAAGKTLAREGAEAAGKAAVQAGVRAAAGPVAKAAGRFVPGANVAIAALDVASAYSTVKDPKASTTKKVTSVITAVGSVAAATNIPVVSQVGAAVSTVSSFVGGLFG